MRINTANKYWSDWRDLNSLLWIHSPAHHHKCFSRYMVLLEGFEPSTFWLKASYATIASQEHK